MQKIAFIGLGHMGLPMATNLQSAGFDVIGFDLQEQARHSFVQNGGKVSPTLDEMIDGAEVLITMLQNGHQVKQVCLGAQGLYQKMPKGSLHIDCSTIDVSSARELADHAQSLGLLAVDAPVSGGVAGASAKTLTFMLGGSDKALAKAEPILRCMGKTIIKTGTHGSGQAAKICNNMMLGISMIATSEAFLLAEKLGLAKEKLHEVVSHSSGQCWVMDKYVPVSGVLEHVPANHGYKPGFSAMMMLKDLRLAQESSTQAGLVTKMGALAQELYEQMSQENQAQMDFSAIIKLIERQ